jgi:cell division protein ZapA
MPSVSVTINGKIYRMACDDGQEKHLMDLADQLNGTIDELRRAFGEIGDQRLIVMAAITLADEASEMRLRADRAEESMNKLAQSAADTSLAEAIGRSAERVADIARRLNAER